MGFLEDDHGNKSMMRKLVLLLAWAIVIWATAEIVTYIWMSALEKTFVIHGSFFLAALGIVFGGKATQKGIEMFKKNPPPPPEEPIG